MSLVHLRIKPGQTCQHMHTGNPTKPLSATTCYYTTYYSANVPWQNQSKAWQTDRQTDRWMDDRQSYRYLVPCFSDATKIGHIRMKALFGLNDE